MGQGRKHTERNKDNSIRNSNQQNINTQPNETYIAMKIFTRIEKEKLVITIYKNI